MANQTSKKTEAVEVVALHRFIPNPDLTIKATQRRGGPHDIEMLRYVYFEGESYQDSEGIQRRASTAIATLKVAPEYAAFLCGEAPAPDGSRRLRLPLCRRPGNPKPE